MIARLIRPGRGTTVLRRCLTIPGIALAAALVWPALPLWLAVTLVADLVRDRGAGRRGRPRWTLTRVLLFVAGYLACELAGLLVAFALWSTSLVLRPPLARYRRWNFRLQCLWGSALMRIGSTVFGYRFEITGADQVTPGPVLVLLRHTSLADTVLAVSLVSRPHDLVLRYVLKRPLLMDPCIDVVGLRLVNTFILRGEKTRAQLERVAALAADLADDEGVLIYPEGTRHTAEKRADLLAKLERRGATAELAYARSLRHLLPPIRGGVLGLLETNARQERPADVLFCAHAGFEGSATLPDLLAGRLVGRTVRVHFWRAAHDSIPATTGAREEWLRRQWSAMDDAVEELQARDAAC